MMDTPCVSEDLGRIDLPCIPPDQQDSWKNHVLLNAARLIYMKDLSPMEDETVCVALDICCSRNCNEEVLTTYARSWLRLIAESAGRTCHGCVLDEKDYLACVRGARVKGVDPLDRYWKETYVDMSWLPVASVLYGPDVDGTVVYR